MAAIGSDNWSRYRTCQVSQTAATDLVANTSENISKLLEKMILQYFNVNVFFSVNFYLPEMSFRRQEVFTVFTYKIE